MSASSSRPGPRGRAASWPSTLPRCVPLTTATSHALLAQGLDQRADRGRVGAPIRDGGAVPVEDDRFESPGEELGAQDFERRFTTCVVDPG